MRRCTFCGREGRNTDWPTSRWTMSGYSPWCASCHSRFATGDQPAPEFSLAKPGRKAETPDGFIPLDEAARRIGQTPETMLDGLKRQKFRGVERQRRLRGVEKSVVWFIHEAQLANWIQKRQFASQQFHVAPGRARSGFTKRALEARA